MKKISPRWACLVQPPRNPRLPPVHAIRQHTAPFSNESISATSSRRQYQPRHQWRYGRKSIVSRRSASTATAAFAQEEQDDVVNISSSRRPKSTLNAPSHRQALHSAKLAALHARLSLPSKLPLQTLARCLIDSSVDSRTGYNNSPFAVLGQDLLGYYTSEWLLCHYPRLPMSVLFAAQFAYVGPQTLASMREEWGVEVVAAPGKEVDAGLLQLTRIKPGNAMSADGFTLNKNLPGADGSGAYPRPDMANWHRRSISSRIVYDDEFGELSLKSEDERPYAGAPSAISAAELSAPADPPSSSNTAEEKPDYISEAQDSNLREYQPVGKASPSAGTTVEAASANFVRALAGALYVHAGTEAAKAFHKDHVLSRQLPLHKLFHFTYPTRDLSRLCLREGLEPPVARLISETGRYSRTPVFVVGVYSGDDKLGEGAGASLDEGRIRAAASALRSWYLYSPVEEDVMLPSATEGDSAEKKPKWKPQLIDIGEVVT